MAMGYLDQIAGGPAGCVQLRLGALPVEYRSDQLFFKCRTGGGFYAGA
jgi:hypothetical protein